MTNYLTSIGKADVAPDTLERPALYADERTSAAPYRIQVGQRFHRVGLTAVVFRVISVYRDAQGLEHATLMDEGRRLDKKTLSASVLLDRTQYRLI